MIPPKDRTTTMYKPVTLTFPEIKLKIGCIAFSFKVKKVSLLSS